MFAAETYLYGNVEHQSIVNYLINDSLHTMIRDSPNDVCRMLSQIERETFDSSSDDDIVHV